MNHFSNMSSSRSSTVSPDSPKLTARQQQIFELIQRAIANTGSPPTRAEIANELGFKSANAAEEHLQALARKGVIELVSGTSRGIRLRAGDMRSVNESRLHQFSLPLQSLAQLVLPLVGRVAAGSPILAQEHIEQTYSFGEGMFEKQPDYLLKVRGMSMRDVGIMDGDLLAVNQAREAKVMRFQDSGFAMPILCPTRRQQHYSPRYLPTRPPLLRASNS